MFDFLFAVFNIVWGTNARGAVHADESTVVILD